MFPKKDKAYSKLLYYITRERKFQLHNTLAISLIILIMAITSSPSTGTQAVNWKPWSLLKIFLSFNSLRSYYVSSD